MAILNKDSYYRIETSLEPVGSTFWTPPQCKTVHGTIIFDLRDFSDRDYWYIDIFHGNSFESYPVETVIPLSILRRIWTKEIFLLIANSQEAYHSIVEGLYQSLILRGNIDPGQIILLSESPDILKEVEIVSEKYKVGHIKVEWMREFEYNAKHQRLARSGNHLRWPLATTLVDKKYDKKFLSFNRNMVSREHRASILALLCSMNVLDSGHISIGASDVAINWDYLLWAIIELHKNDAEILKLLEDNSEKIKNIGRIVLDEQTAGPQNLAYINSNVDYLYTDTYFSVITETNALATGPNGGYSGPGRLLSEKTFKPIAYCHPFIITARPHTLALLKGLGYKTFSPYIDERYDAVTDDSTRMIMIATEIKRLCELSPLELTEFLNNVKEICKFNYDNLLLNNNYITRLN